MFLLLILFAPAVFILLMELKYFNIKKKLNRIRGPETLPVIGNTHMVGNTPNENLEVMLNWCRKYDYEAFRFWLGYFPHVVLTSVKDVEFVLTSKTLTQKADVYHLLHPWLGGGLLTSNGLRWHQHRKMITPSFHFKILQNFHEIMNSKSTKFMEKLKEASAGDTIFDFQDIVQYLTLDVICETAMGISINAMDDRDSELVAAFQDICYNINERMFNPIKRKDLLYKLFPEYAKYKKTLATLKGFTEKVIKNRIEVLKNTDTTTKTDDDDVSSNKMAFLDTLLSSTIDGKPLTVDDVNDEVSTFMFGGHDTTTTGISFAIYMLSRHPEVQQKVFAEQQEIMADNLKRSATFQEISEMKYLDLVIKESQRLYPSVPSISRCTDKEYDINGNVYPKGITLDVILMAMGYNEKSFPDPYRCKPERFDIDISAEKVSPFQFAPFSAGPRNCIGQKFASLQLKTVVSKIVRTFEILPPLDELVSKDGYVEHFIGLPKDEQLKRRPNPSKYDPILTACITLKSQNGIQIRLRERK